MISRTITNLRLLNSKRPENRAFDRNIVRDESLLSHQDKEFLKKWSFGGFGIAGVLYLLLRNLYESLGLLAVAGYLGNFIEKHWSSVLYDSGAAVWIRVAVWTTVVIVIIGWAYGIYFLARHSRRLSWNRCAWKSIEEFRRSEKYWFWGNFVGSILLLAVLYI